MIKYHGITHLVAQKGFSCIEEGSYRKAAAATLLTGVTGVVDGASCVGVATIQLVGALLVLPYGLSASREKLSSSVGYLGRAVTFFGAICETPLALLDLNEAYGVLHKLQHRKLQQTLLPFILPPNEERSLPHVGDLYGIVAPSNHPRLAERVTRSSALYPLAWAMDGLIQIIFCVGRLVGAAFSLVLKTMVGTRAVVRNMVGKEEVLGEAELEASLDAWVADRSSEGNKAEAKARIMKAFRYGSTHLVLNNLGLTKLPPEIGRLNRLTTLDLGNSPQIPFFNKNQLTTLPPEIGQLTQLKRLNLCGNQLTTLPREIWLLNQLQWLDLSFNQLTTLPPEIEGLNQLQWLDLGANQLTILPPEIGLLNQLQWLDLGANQLTILPPEFGLLIRLKTLNLNNNRLTVLLPEIEQLNQLLRLNLNSNPLADLPLEVTKLNQLQELFLSNTRLTVLRPEIEQLSGLTILDLSHNELKCLPRQIGQLNRLATLYVNGNQLEALPSEIGLLNQLVGLDVQSNSQLSILPMSLGQLRNLTHISAYNTLVPTDMRQAILAATARLRREDAAGSLPEKLQLWRAASGGDFDLSSVLQFNDGDKGTLYEWLTRLERARDFRGDAQPIMARAVCEMLVEATTNTAFKEALVTQAESNNTNCQDRAAMALNELYTFLKLMQLRTDASLQEQFTLLARAAKTVALRNAVGKRIVERQRETGNRLEEAVQIYLFCETRLKERLDLLSIISGMSFERLGNVPWIDLRALEEEVLGTYLDHLIILPAFERLAEGEEYKEGHEAEYARFHQELEGIDPHLPEQEQLANTEAIQKRRQELERQHKKEWAQSCLHAL